MRSNLYTAADLTGLENIAGRNPNGTGNNTAEPDWGATNTTFRRVTETSHLEDVNETSPRSTPRFRR